MTTNAADALLPCPFCGERPTLMANSVVECRNCPTGKYSGYVTADISAWGNRASLAEWQGEAVGEVAIHVTPEDWGRHPEMRSHYVNWLGEAPPEGTLLYTNPALGASFDVFAREFGLTVEPYPAALPNPGGLRFKHQHANEAWKAWVASHQAPAVVDDAMVERACAAAARIDSIDWHDGEWQATHTIEVGRLRHRMRAALTAAMQPKAGG